MRKTAIVTGASRGIGRIIALRMAAGGFRVVVNYQGKAEEGVNEITGAGGRALAIQADVANTEAVKQLFEKTIETFGQIDVVVNNAGIMPLSPIAKGDVETFDKVIATNLRGTLPRPLVGGATRRRGRPHHRRLQQRTREILPYIRTLSLDLTAIKNKSPEGIEQ
jgi:NAD(P)-dependent dehydrogenase (short-subunit alcohol dehydrogenase family)